MSTREEATSVFEAMTLRGIAQSLDSIEIAVWLLVGLVLLSNVLIYARFRKQKTAKADPQADWQANVETAYDKGDYESALQTLATVEVLYPRSALVKFWQGRCHFQKEAWTRAAEKFEESLRPEPYYRRSVRDYMAFIELNELVPGVTGYLDTPRTDEDD